MSIIAMITRPMSTEFTVGMAVRMEIINDRGDFRIASLDNSHFKTFGFAYRGHLSQYEQPEKFTCHTCDEVGMCDYAYDPYNIDGDCLKLK